MISITLDTTQLEAKIRRAKQSIIDSIETGTKAGTETMFKDIDEFMFVPLSFETRIAENGEDTVSKTKVALNIPRKIVRNRKPWRQRRTFHKREKKQPAKAWTEYVQELSRGSDVVSDAVEKSIREDLP